MPVIDYGNGWKFKYLLENEDTTPEIYGTVEAPNGSLVKEASGFYRTDDPVKAAEYARVYIGGETYY